MVGEAIETWFPNRIAGKFVFIVATDPSLQFLASLFRNNFDSIMHEAQANAFRSPLVDKLQATSIFFDSFVTASSS